MKRTFKRADGTEETLEGSAEELAEYERRLRESEGRGPKPGVLKGRELGDLLKDLLERPEVDELARKFHRPYWPPGPIWVVSCSICGRVGCDGNHWPQPLYQPYTITTTTTTEWPGLGEAPRLDGVELVTWQGSSGS